MTGFPDDYWTRAEALRSLNRYQTLDDDPLGMARGVLVALLAGGMFSLGLFVGVVFG